jgi:hypothetical protein
VATISTFEGPQVLACLIEYRRRNNEAATSRSDRNWTKAHHMKPGLQAR